MAKEHIELRLSGLSAADGEISLADLAPLAKALQNLTTVLARGLTATGRLSVAASAAAQIKLESIEAGSTTLRLSLGAESPELSLETELAARLAELFAAIRAGARPAWATPVVTKAARSLVETLARARVVEFRREGGGPPVSFQPGAVDRGVWTELLEGARQSGASFSGTLEAVDLRTGRCRILDDVGHALPVDGIVDLIAAGALIGTRVVVRGEAELGARGQIVRMHAARIDPQNVPPEWNPASWEEISRQEERSARLLPGPGRGGITGVTEVEVEEFLAVLRE